MQVTNPPTPTEDKEQSLEEAATELMAKLNEATQHPETSFGMYINSWSWGLMHGGNIVIDSENLVHADDDAYHKEETSMACVTANALTALQQIHKDLGMAIKGIGGNLAIKEPSINSYELATVLAALRWWQREIKKKGIPAMFSEHFFDHSPMGVEAIDSLCERLNVDDPPVQADKFLGFGVVAVLEGFLDGIKLMGWTDSETDRASELLPRVLEELKTLQAKITKAAT